MNTKYNNFTVTLSFKTVQELADYQKITFYAYSSSLNLRLKPQDSGTPGAVAAVITSKHKHLGQIS